MSWSEVQEGKKKVKKIVKDLDPKIECEILEPIGEDFDKNLYPVILKKGRVKEKFKLSMEDLEDIVADTSIEKKIRRLLQEEIQKLIYQHR